MTVRTVDIVLRKAGEASWVSEGLSLPAARPVAVLDQRGASIPFRLNDGSVVVEGRSPTSLVARLELGEDLVASSTLEQSKLELEREKVASAERLARRTLVVSVVTALVSAGATIAVAAIATYSGKPEKSPTAAYKDLDECYDGLLNLKSLASLDTQTLPDLRAAVRRQADDCGNRIRAAKSAALLP